MADTKQCQRCGGDSGIYRMHPDPHECISVLMDENDRLVAKLERLDNMNCETCRHLGPNRSQAYGGWCAVLRTTAIDTKGGCRAWEGR